jgi:hypothetical protein
MGRVLAWFLAFSLGSWGLLGTIPALSQSQEPTPTQAERASPARAANLRLPNPKAIGGQGSGAKAQIQAQGKSDPETSSRAAVPKVMSQAAAEAQRPRSQFLLQPGTSSARKYDPEVIDWRDIPPWRQTSFFGIRARGQCFVFVVDQSGSMIDDDRLTRAKIELRRSVFALQPPQRFEAIFYNDQATPMPGGPLPRPADQRTKDQLLVWLRLIDPAGQTNPRVAMAQALALRPDAVFLLSDGELPDGTAGEIAKLNTHKVPIHCVDLAGGLAGNQLQNIARESGGQYASRPGNLQGTP